MGTYQQSRMRSLHMLNTGDIFRLLSLVLFSDYCKLEFEFALTNPQQLAEDHLGWVTRHALSGS